jgi:hypothetical protein
LTARRSNHLARSHPPTLPDLIHNLARFHPPTLLDLIYNLARSHPHLARSHSRFFLSDPGQWGREERAEPHLQLRDVQLQRTVCFQGQYSTQKIVSFTGVVQPQKGVRRGTNR